MLSSFDVRLHAIRLENFKNVTNGEICLTRSSTRTGANILGIYGQNGSGKTALIDALCVFKYAAVNRQLPKDYAGRINTAADYAKLTYVFDISQKETRDCYTVTYELKLRKETDPDAQATPASASRVIIFDEVLSLALQGKTRQIRKGRFIDTISDVLPFTPKAKFKTLTGGGQKMALDLAFQKGSQQNQSRSFVFSPQLRDLFEHRSKDETLKPNEKEEILIVLSVLRRLARYADSELFVLKNQDGTGTIHDTLMPLVKANIGKINPVLNAVIPGLTLSLGVLGEKTQDSALVQLVAVRDGQEIPLACESKGIRKIIAVLSLFIALYNKRSVTVAADDLDAGIFEFLLGELLRLLSEKGKGQLIFSAHNLRPLETLPEVCIAFTTSDPRARYCRPKALKASNNLRDIYYREILVGDGHWYERTPTPKIAAALREAWFEKP